MICIIEIIYIYVVDVIYLSSTVDIKKRHCSYAHITSAKSQVEERPVWQLACIVACAHLARTKSPTASKPPLSLLTYSL